MDTTTETPGTTKATQPRIYGGGRPLFGYERGDKAVLDGITNGAIVFWDFDFLPDQKMYTVYMAVNPKANEAQI